MRWKRLKEIKWFKISSELEPKQALEDDQKARLIAKKRKLYRKINLGWYNSFKYRRKHSIHKSVTRYKEIEYIDGNFETREGILWVYLKGEYKYD